MVPFFFWVLLGIVFCAQQSFAAEKTAPDISLHDLNGKVWTLSSLRGQWVLVNFWATWCGPCIKEMPELERFSQSPNGRRMVVLAVSESLTSHQKLMAFLDRLHITYTVLNDPFGEVADAYHVRALPTTALISPQGRLEWVIRGGVPFMDPSFLKNDLPKEFSTGAAK